MSHMYETWMTLFVRCRDADGKETTVQGNPEGRPAYHYGADPDLSEDALTKAICAFGTHPLLSRDNKWACTAKGREKVEALCANKRAGIPVEAWKALQGTWR